MARKGNKYNTTQNSKLSGIHIYNDDHGRCIYYDVISKSGYVLDDREQAYRPYAMRFFLGLFAAVLFYMFEMPIAICIGLGVGVYVLMEVKFRMFLKNVPQLLDFKPQKRVGFVDSAANEKKNKILLKAVLYIALAVLIVINAYQQKYTGVMLGVNYVISVIAIYFAVIQILALFKKK